MAKVLIIGGGLAGLSCALNLLGQGHHVTVAEKQKGRLDKVCGEGILPFGVSLLKELGLAEKVAQVGFSFKGVTWAHGTRRIEGQFQSGSYGIGIDRAKLDEVFKTACSQYKDFSLQVGKRIQPGDEAGYDAVLGADGVYSSWGKATGKRVRFGKRLGLRFRIKAKPPPVVTVHFFRHLEVYFTPVNTQITSVAFLVDAHHLKLRGGELKQWVQAFFGQHFPQYAKHPITDLATRAPISSKILGPAPSCILLGDALCAFDPISGAGMSFALLCGKLAAQHLNEPTAYYRALRPHRAALAGFTNAQLFFRGGGFKTRLMFRQLALANCFNRILSLHNGHHRLTDLPPKAAMSLLRPW